MFGAEINCPCLFLVYLDVSCHPPDIPEEEARYWTKKLEQINSLEEAGEVRLLFAMLLQGQMYSYQSLKDPSLGTLRSLEMISYLGSSSHMRSKGPICLLSL